MAESNNGSGWKTFEELFISEIVFASVVQKVLGVAWYRKLYLSLPCSAADALCIRSFVQGTKRVNSSLAWFTQA